MAENYTATLVSAAVTALNITELLLDRDILQVHGTTATLENPEFRRLYRLGHASLQAHLDIVLDDVLHGFRLNTPAILDALSAAIITNLKASSPAPLDPTRAHQAFCYSMGCLAEDIDSGRFEKCMQKYLEAVLSSIREAARTIGSLADPMLDSTESMLESGMSAPHRIEILRETLRMVFVLNQTILLCRLPPSSSCPLLKTRPNSTRATYRIIAMSAIPQPVHYGPPTAAQIIEAALLHEISLKRFTRKMYSLNKIESGFWAGTDNKSPARFLRLGASTFRRLILGILSPMRLSEAELQYSMDALSSPRFIANMLNLKESHVC
ncbi:hypothetical protein FB451DRAFT_1537670 [Mycena latifolia]|nr:hypothetical protein FB451DRAFT_1537670 [Mycena latifolia]